jgi:hypothetical protein
MKLTIPDGFELPPETEEGGEFTVVATFKDNEDGTITLLEIDGAKIADTDKKKDRKSLYSRGKEAGY